ncbi:MAG: hypothetical protein AAF602_07700 [Myxococcota bacterium]
MANEVDELFSDDAAGVKPRVGLVFTLTFVGIGIALLGFPCSAVPGGIVVLVSWYFAEREFARLQSGFYPSDLRSRIGGARQLAIGGVIAMALIFALQLVLTRMGAYEVWWPSIVMLLGNVLWGGPPEG